MPYRRVSAKVSSRIDDFDRRRCYVRAERPATRATAPAGGTEGGACRPRHRLGGAAGEVWVLVALNLYSTVAAEPDLAIAAYRLMSVLVFAGGIPLSMTALVSGVVLAVGSHWGLARHLWVFVKLLLLVAVILIGMFLFQPAVSAAGMQDGSLTVGRQWQQVAVVGSQLTMLVIATVLAVFKPRWRIDWSRVAHIRGV